MIIIIIITANSSNNLHPNPITNPFFFKERKKIIVKKQWKKKNERIKDNFWMLFSFEVFLGERKKKKRVRKQSLEVSERHFISLQKVQGVESIDKR